jgi:hypothetical protein
MFSQLNSDCDEVVRTAMGAFMRSLHGAPPETKPEKNAGAMWSQSAFVDWQPNAFGCDGWSIVPDRHRTDPKQ